MTCVPGAPTASPGDSLGSGEPFPGRERQPRHRKSENPDNSGSSLPAVRNCRSSQHLSLPESIRPGASTKTRAESPISQAPRGCVLTSKAVPRRQLALLLCRAKSLGSAIKLTDMRRSHLRLGASSGRVKLGRDRLDQGCFHCRKAPLKHGDGVPKIVSARCQRNGEQRICDI
jgi:hypothetical protein